MNNKLWTPPMNIHIVEVLNNRELNPNYIDSLAESMELNGYLADYPIEVFEAKNIPLVQTDKPYVCACGAHRTRAALKAKISEVLIVIHQGGEEDWIETMSLDNFKFDVAADSSIGQTFSQKEKRAACIQLLLLPKYLKMTNTALADAWNTAEGNIRRWRKEVASLIDEAPTVRAAQEKLRTWGISKERFRRLKGVLESTEREDADGKVVTVRRKAREATDDEKSEFFSTIKQDAGHWGNTEDATFLKRHDLQWGDIDDFIREKWNVEGNHWGIGTELSMPQLRKLHNLILAEDAQFLARCLEIADARKETETVNRELSEACDVCASKVLDTFCPGVSKYSDKFDSVRSQFCRAAEEQGYFSECADRSFSLKSYNYHSKNLDDLRVATNQLRMVIQDIEDGKDWVTDLKVKIGITEAETRRKLEADWLKAKKKMLDALKAYPRDISIDAFCYAFDNRFREQAGYCLKRIHKDAPSRQTGFDRIEIDTRHFKTATADLERNADWVKGIPKPTRLIDKLAGHANVYSVSIDWWDDNDAMQGAWFTNETEIHSNSARPIPLSEIPDALLRQLLEIAKKEADNA